MAHVHVPFQVEEVSLLTITKVYDRQSPAKLKGTEKNKKQAGHPLSTINIRESFVQVHLPIPF